jgi:hypothetical protein
MMYSIYVSDQKQGVVRVRLRRAGEGARELFPWTAGPGTHKYFDPQHPLAGDSLALVLCNIHSPLRLPSSLALFISHPLPIPRGPQRPRARLNVFVYWGGKRSKVSPRGVLNLPAARFLQTKRFDPLPFPPKFKTGTNFSECIFLFFHIGVELRG